MSIDEGEENEIKGFELGAADYIHKPVTEIVRDRIFSRLRDTLTKK